MGVTDIGKIKGWGFMGVTDIGEIIAELYGGLRYWQDKWQGWLRYCQGKGRGFMGGSDVGEIKGGALWVSQILAR